MKGHELPQNISLQSSPRERRGLLVMILLLIGVVALFILAKEWRSSLKIQRLSVKGLQTLSVKEIFVLANLPQRTSMYGCNLMEVQERVLSHPFVKLVGVNRQFPDGLTIEVVEREPVASLSCGNLRYVDAEGVLLPNVDSQRKFDLPVISGIDGMQNVQVGKTALNKEVVEALAICQTAQSLDTIISRMISEINMNHGSDIILYSADAGVPMILGRGDVVKKLIMLENFWKSVVSMNDVEKLKYIDLRFDDQVIVKWAQAPDRQGRKISS